MAIYKVTASVTFEYDTEDGYIADENEALLDAQSMIFAGDVWPDAYDFDVEESV